MSNTEQTMGYDPDNDRNLDMCIEVNPETGGRCNYARDHKPLPFHENYGAVVDSTLMPGGSIWRNKDFRPHPKARFREQVEERVAQYAITYPDSHLLYRNPHGVAGQMTKIADEALALTHAPLREENFNQLCPVRFRDAEILRVEEPQQEALRRWVADYITEDRRRGICLAGTTGAGKTYTAAATLRHLITRAGFRQTGFTPYYYIRAEVYLEARRLSFDRKKADDEAEEESLSLVDRLSDTDVLWLDDLASETFTDWGRAQLFQVVDNRYADLKPTIVTANLDLSELESVFGDRLMRRLTEDALVLEFDKKYESAGIS